MADDKAPTRLIAPLLGPTVEAMEAEARQARQAGADTVELRLDALRPTPSAEDIARLIRQVPVETLATCRPKRQGGHFQGSEGERLDVLLAAGAAGADWLDVEDDAIGARPWPVPVIVSHHDYTGPPADLPALAEKLAACPQAAAWKIAFAAEHPADALAALDPLHRLTRPGICLAMGEAGLASRVLAAAAGAWGTFAAIAPDRGSAAGQPTLAEMRDLYRFGSIGPATALLGVVGCPVGHSMSPAIHNAALAAAGIDGVYLPLLTPPGYESFARLIDALARRPRLNAAGLSVTIPHKEDALRYLRGENVEPLAAEIGAVNTLTFHGRGPLSGHNTDYAGALDALTDAMDISRDALAGRTVAVLGAGGAARALVAALVHYQAEVIVANRTYERAETLAREFGARPARLAEVERLGAEILINCTPLGMHPHTEASPLKAVPPQTRAVFDTIYNPVQTRLLGQAAAAGCQAISGVDMFVNQGAEQFRLWTGQQPPIQAMREVVLRHLTGGADR